MKPPADNPEDQRDAPPPPSAPPASPPRPRRMSTASGHAIGARSSGRGRVWRRGDARPPSRRIPNILARGVTTTARNNEARSGSSGATGSPLKSELRFRRHRSISQITMNRARSVSSAPVDETDMARGTPQRPRSRKKGIHVAGFPSRPWIAGSFSMSLARATVNLSAARAHSLRGGDLRVPRRTVAVKSRRAVANTVSEMNKVRLRARPRAIDRPRDETKSLPRTPSPAVPNVDDAVP